MLLAFSVSKVVLDVEAMGKTGMALIEEKKLGRKRRC